MSLRVNSRLNPTLITSNPIPLPASNDTQILSNVNGTNSFSYNNYNFDTTDLFPENTVDISSFSYFDPTQQKFAGGVLAPNGNIYCIPHSANYVAIINPYSKTVDTTSITNVQGGRTNLTKWYGGVLAPNGKIYCVPYNASNILIINTLNNSVSYITGITQANYPSLNTYVSNGDQEKWIGGAIASNGKIYCAPYFARCSLIIDTNNDTVNLTDIANVDISSYPGLIIRGLTSNQENFGGAVLGPNGRIYFTPSNANGVLQINPINNTADGSSYIYPPNIYDSGNRYKSFGGCLGPDNNIYIAPWYISTSAVGVRRFVKIDVTKDVSNQQFTIVTPDASVNISSAYQGVVCGMNGKLYAIANGATNIAIIDPITSTANTTRISPVTNGYSGGVLGPDGVIYCIPRNAPTIMTIKTGIPTQQPWMLTNEFNKF